MIEGWVTAVEAMPELSAATVVLARRRPAPASAAATSAALPFARFCEDEALVRSWRRLEAVASLPMQTHAFASALANTLLAGAHIEVFHIRQGDDVAALVALCRDTGPFARWTAVGAHQVCEPDDALYRNPRAVRLLADAIMGGGRAVELDRVPAGSQLIPALRSALRGKGWVSVRPATPTPTISLDAQWRDPASRFNSGRRSDFRRAARRAGEFGQVSFEIVSPGPAEFDALFDEAIGVEARSWKREAGTAIAVDRAKERCFRHYFRSACERRELRIAFMRIDGRAVAMQMALEYLDRYWLFKIGFDEQYERCSPGTLLMLHTIGWAAERELRAYELLGNLEPWIAQFWTREQHDCVWVRAYPFNARGAVALAADAFASLRRRLGRA
ncbi:MAG TPA: GNAT family N-acetyltransferase [Allosphingosinicella sp.]|jgi:CelD/BcsL family acetyltransferase involved in cellulose biosynthesis|nr:GNAT family N-acetyltransferase [Allosphingosinicella sp.]